MKRIILSLFTGPLFFSFIHAQDTQKNLIPNGNFEKGNSEFSSSFRYNPFGLYPGEYSITRHASSLSNDLKNPGKGNHSIGNGNFLVASSNDEPGKKIWCSKVFVLPNSMYRFSVSFCNLYKHKPSYGIMINGYQMGGIPKGNDPELKVTINNRQIGETDKDVFQMFRWLKANAEWYSGKDSGLVDLCIENVNTRAEGNDVAIDDVVFYYQKTMPPGYEPPVNATIMNEEYRVNLEQKNKPDHRRIIAFSELTNGDSLAQGIRTLYPKEKPASDALSKGEKIVLHNLIFQQKRSDLLPEAKNELEKLASWMHKNPTIKIRLEGHTDNIGDPELNIKLSEERVKGAKEYLIYLGVEEERIETIGYGGSQPIADNSNEQGRQLNRRIEFVIIEK